MSRADSAAATRAGAVVEVDDVSRMILDAFSRSSWAISSTNLETVDVGHQRVREHEVERLAAVGRFAQGGQSRGRAVDGRGLHLPAGKNLGQDGAIRRVVVHDERAQIAQGAGAGADQIRGVLVDAEHGHEIETAALARLAEPEPSVHELHELGGDREAEAGARSGASWTSACSNAPKILHCLSWAMPMPVSRTMNRSVMSSSVRRSTVTSTTTSPSSVNFTALPTRFRMICRRRPASPMSASGISGAIRAGRAPGPFPRRGSRAALRRPRQCRGSGTARVRASAAVLRSSTHRGCH